jgi:hypothetical protein
MKKQNNWNHFLGSSAAIALTFVIGFSAPSQSAEPRAGKIMTDGNMADRCQGMLKLKQKLNEDTAAQDIELAEQVAAMNSAADDKKSRHIAAVVTKMAEQRAVMNARSVKMHDEMMKHLLQHMQTGTESVSHCPMIKGMGFFDENMAKAPKAPASTTK